jgi:hypothetical protein
MRRACVAVLVMLVVQYGLGIFLNLYVAVPASDAHAGFLQEIKTAPPTLTFHALLGLALIGTAIWLLIRAAMARDGVLGLLAALGLAAIGAAFAAGEIFVKNGQASASFAMAVLTGVALLCYVIALAAAGPAQAGRRVARRADAAAASGRGGVPPEGGRSLPHRPVTGAPWPDSARPGGQWPDSVRRSARPGPARPEPVRRAAVRMEPVRQSGSRPAAQAPARPRAGWPEREYPATAPPESWFTRN